MSVSKWISGEFSTQIWNHYWLLLYIKWVLSDRLSSRAYPLAWLDTSVMFYLKLRTAPSIKICLCMNWKWKICSFISFREVFHSFWSRYGVNGDYLRCFRTIEHAEKKNSCSWKIYVALHWKWLKWQFNLPSSICQHYHYTTLILILMYVVYENPVQTIIISVDCWSAKRLWELLMWWILIILDCFRNFV